MHWPGTQVPGCQDLTRATLPAATDREMRSVAAGRAGRPHYGFLGFTSQANACRAFGTEEYNSKTHALGYEPLLIVFLQKRYGPNRSPASGLRMDMTTSC